MMTPKIREAARHSKYKTFGGCLITVLGNCNAKHVLKHYNLTLADVNDIQSATANI